MKIWIGMALVLAAQPAVGRQAPVQPLPVARLDNRPVIEAEIAATVAIDWLPERKVAELRPSARLVLTTIPSPSISLKFDGVVEGLVAQRGGQVTGVRGEVRDGWIEWRGRRGDVRVGYGRLVWGRLDEIAPTDVINPIDAARFLLDGRAEARLPVAVVRGRVSAGEKVQLEGVAVPIFRRGLFDRLDEPTSPFNLVADAAVPPSLDVDPADRSQREPKVAWQNVSGGARAGVTAGRVDVSASLFRGFDGFGPVLLEIGAGAAPEAIGGRLVEHHPRFTMVGADVETVTGAWAWRGELALFTDRQFASSSRLRLVKGRAIDAGAGFDRRVGEFRTFGSVVVHREWSDEDPFVARTDLTVIGSIERSFGRDRYLARGFAVVNPADASAFLRGLVLWRETDRIAVEVSGGLFLGTSADTIGRFQGRDFLMSRLRVRF